VRRDVQIVNALLVNLDWYPRQPRDGVPREYRRMLAEAAWQRGDRAELVSHLRRGYHLFPDPAPRRTLTGAERVS
jgi:hypothetical protein